MSPQKTIYVKDTDIPLWERFEKATKVGAAAGSVSALIAHAMHHYLAQFGDQGGGLYVQAPDEEAVAFGVDISAVLVRDATTTWTLLLDEVTYGESAQSQVIGSGPLPEVITAARTHLADSLSSNDLQRAASRLRRALGIEGVSTAAEGRRAGREWALHRAAPAELEAMGQLVPASWVSLGPSSATGGEWPTLYAEVARHRPMADSGSGSWEIPRDDFMVGFVEEASDVYGQILETERQAGATGA
jgi:hypothetical protein